MPSTEAGVESLVRPWAESEADSRDLLLQANQGVWANVSGHQAEPPRFGNGGWSAKVAAVAFAAALAVVAIACAGGARLGGAAPNDGAARGADVMRRFDRSAAAQEVTFSYTSGKKHTEFAGKQPAASLDTRHQGRTGSFLVIGDWGYDAENHYINLNEQTCVKTIADKMDEKFDELGDVKFIINVGDSFYPSGVASKTDPQWQTKWRDVFSPKLRSVPWYSVYGNHDLHIDPCACTDDLSKCAQINADATNLDYFVMPNYTYYTPFPDLDMEVIGLDMNYFMPGWDSKLKISELGFPDCQWTACNDTCGDRFARRMGASFDLFYNRVEHSKAKNLLVFSHYPTDYFMGGAPWFLDGLRNKSVHDIMYFGGHRHSTDTWSTCSISPNTNWLVGGGGGYSCDSDDQGFVVGEVHADYSVDTYAVLVDKELCCLPPTTTSTSSTSEAEPMWT